MVQSTRRRLLRAGSAGLGAGLAGCGALRNPLGPPEARIGGLAALNYRDREHTLVARLRSGDETVYRQPVTVPGYDAAADDAGDAAFTDLPGGPAPYVLGVRLDEQPPGEWTTFDTTEHDAPCFSFLVEMGNPRRDGTGDGVTVWYSTGSGECGSA